MQVQRTIRYLRCSLTVSTSMMSTTTMKTTVMTMHSELLPCYGPKISEHFFLGGGGGGGGGGRGGWKGAAPELLDLTHTLVT